MRKRAKDEKNGKLFPDAELEAPGGDELPFRTVLGYPMDQVVSALQKEIRRGHELEAAWWALELAESGQEWRLWRRLAIIAGEDVGLGDLDAVRHFTTCWALRQVAGQSRGYKFLLVLAVMILCRAKKSHEVDHLKSALSGMRNRGVRLPIPEYALDLHTKAGRAKGLTEKDPAALLAFYLDNWACTNMGEPSRYLDLFVDETATKLGLSAKDKARLSSTLRGRGE